MNCFKVFFATIVFILLFSQSIIGKYNDSIKAKDEVRNNLLQLRYEFSQYNNLNLLQEFSKDQVSGKSPWLAFGLSLMFPGLGQIYNGDYTKAAVQAGMVLGGFGLVALTGCTECGQAAELQNAAFFTGLGLTFVGYVWSLFDAPISANNINSEIDYANKQSTLNLKSGTFIKNQMLHFPSNNLISLKIGL